MSIDIILYLIGFVLAVLAGFGIKAREQNLLAWSVAVLILTLLI